MANKKTKTPEAGSVPAPEKASAKGAAVKAAGKAKEDQAVASFSIKDKVEQAREFFEQSKAEIKKVTWPTRRETVQTGLAVLVFSVVMAIYLGVVDLALSKLVALILS